MSSSKPPQVDLCFFCCCYFWTCCFTDHFWFCTVDLNLVARHRSRRRWICREDVWRKETGTLRSRLHIPLEQWRIKGAEVTGLWGNFIATSTSTCTCTCTYRDTYTCTACKTCTVPLTRPLTVTVDVGVLWFLKKLQTSVIVIVDTRAAQGPRALALSAEL